MKWFRSYKQRVYRLNQPLRMPKHRPLPFTSLLFAVLICGWCALAPHANPDHQAIQQPGKIPFMSQLPAGQLPALLSTTPGKVKGRSTSKPGVLAPPSNHTNVTTTVFWVGEPADSENAYITNTESAWDEHWQAHYGGVDDPAKRNGYMPAAFTPLENPFYFALPYNDFESGAHRDTAASCLLYTTNTNDRYSWCKNIWIAITHNGVTTYAQWEDVGPLEENDSAYVFGTAAPTNTFGAKAGLDVSPAVRDYLHLSDVDHTSWTFVPATSVPDGPWKTHVTTSLGSSLY